MLSHISFMRLLNSPLPPSRDNDQVNENVSIGFDAKNWHVVAKSPLHRRNFVSVLCNGNLYLEPFIYNVIDVLWGQPIKLIQVASNPELHENQ